MHNDPLRPMHIDEINFGVVQRALTVGGERKLRGYELTRAELVAMPAANRNALIENRYIRVYPKEVAVRRPAGDVARVEIASGEGEMHVIAKGFGKWDVIQGTIVGSGLTKEAAQQLAGRGEPSAAAVNQDAPQAAAAPAGRKKKRRASPGKHLPPKPPGEPQENGPIED